MQRSLTYDKNGIVPQNNPENLHIIYPKSFMSIAKERSTSVNLRIITSLANTNILCEGCPAGTRQHSHIQYRLLATNHVSALFGCCNCQRCEEYIVKVLFR